MERNKSSLFSLMLSCSDQWGNSKRHEFKFKANIICQSLQKVKRKLAMYIKWMVEFLLFMPETGCFTDA